MRIIKLYKYLCNEKNEYVLSKQLLKSGTSIGANVKEAIQAQSQKDFLAKLQISLKEASETEYWLELIFRSEYLTKEQYDSINTNCLELIKILTSIIKTTKNKND